MSQAAVIRSTIGRWFSAPWYPIPFSAYPVLYLLSFNVGQVDPGAGVRALLLSIISCGILFVLFRTILHDWYRAAFLTMLWSLLFLSYGHIYNLIGGKYPGFNLMPYLLSGWATLAGLAIWWVTRPRLRFVSSAAGLNLIAFGLVVMSLGQISFSSRPRRAHTLPADNAPVESDLVRPQNPPDVYYFLLDSYTRADLLKRVYGYDNSEFIKALQQRGFYVAACSLSNYGRTELSLSSTLNMAYLQGLDHEFVPENIGRLTLWDSLTHSAVRYNFESLGYKVVNFASGFAFIELRDADIFLSPPPLSSGLTEFEGLFVQTTLARHLKDLGWLDPDALMAQNYRDRFLFIFNSMHTLAANPEPTFAYIHVISPHPPFVFGPHGEPTDPADFWNEKRLYPAREYAQGYQNQLTYLNKRVLEAVDTLLTESSTPPVIILQGDHGPWLQPNPQHFMIFNAYYLPGHSDQLYPNISPVNTFRLVFDAYFGGKYDMLKDLSYHSPVPNLFDFTEVPNPCK